MIESHTVSYHPGRTLPALALHAPDEAQLRGLVPGDEVSLDIWHDTSGNGFHAVQANPALQPTLLYDDVRWVVRSDGTQYMTGLPGFSSSLLGHVSIVMANVPASLDVERCFFASSDVGSNARYLGIGLLLGQPHIRQRNNDVQDTVYSNGTLLAAGTRYLLDFESDGSAWRYWLNDTELTPLTVTGTGGNFGDWWGDVSSRDNYSIFARVTSSLQGLTAGDMVSLHVTDRVLNTRARRRFHRWLKSHSSSKNFVAFTRPRSYHTYSASSAGSRRITATGDWAAVATPSGIEAQFGSGPWVAATVNSNGTWSVDLGLIAAGQQGTITARFADNLSVFASVNYVGVGKVVILLGQSNIVTPHTAAQVYTHLTLKASAISFAGIWREAIDPTSDRPVVGTGSMGPLIATRVMAQYNQPVGIIAAAEGGSDMDVDQQPGDRLHEEVIGIIEAAASGGLDLGIWMQGEADMAEDTLQADYMRYLGWIIQSIRTRFPFDAELAVQDTFEDVNGTPLEDHVSEIGDDWVVRQGAWEIQSNTAAVPVGAAADQFHLATKDLGRIHSKVRMTFRFAAGAEFSPGIVLRYDAVTGNFWTVNYYVPTALLQVRHYIASENKYYTLQNEAIAALLPDTDYTLEAFAVGDWIKGDLDGLPIEQRVDFSDDATHVGLWQKAAAEGLGSVSNFEVDGQNGFTLVVMGTGDYNPGLVSVTDDRRDAVQLAQIRAWEEVEGVHPGGSQNYDVEHADGAHFKSANETTILHARVAPFYMAALAGTTAPRGPRFVSATLVDATHVDVTLSTANSLTLGTSPLIGWRVTDDGTPVTVSAVAIQSNGTTAVVRLTLGSPLSGTTKLVSFAKGRDGLNATTRDTTDLGVTALLNGQLVEKFVDKVVA